MEHDGRAAIATLFAAEPLVAGRATALGESEAHHARVRRMVVGTRVRLVDGAGHVAQATLVKLGKSQATVDVETVQAIEPLPPIHLLVPIADRDRMLLLAEKATELGVATWRPVMWTRSRGVSPRGEGVTFQAKILARMTAALTQSGGAWLPVLYPESSPERAIAAAPAGTRLHLDMDGDAFGVGRVAAPVVIAVGPEGGFEDAEREMLRAASFRAVRLAPLTLRFETAAIAALAVVRAATI